MTDDQARFGEALLHTYSLSRYGITDDLSLDLQLTTLSLIGSGSCLMVPLRVGDDMLAVGPMERDQRRLFLPAGSNVQQHDQVTWVDAGGSVWFVNAPPVTHYIRGLAHHVEALVERKAVT